MARSYSFGHANFDNMMTTRTSPSGTCLSLLQLTIEREVFARSTSYLLKPSNGTLSAPNQPQRRELAHYQLPHGTREVGSHMGGTRLVSGPSNGSTSPAARVGGDDRSTYIGKRMRQPSRSKQSISYYH